MIKPRTRTFTVVAQRETGGPYLLTDEDLDTADPATLRVIQYDPNSKVAWSPWSLQAYLARGYWYDPDVATVTVVIERWREAGRPARKAGPMSKQEFLREVARIHDAWAEYARYEVDPKYANNSSSQYAEGIQDVSAIAEDDDIYLSLTSQLMDEWDRSNGRPTKAERLAKMRAKRAADKGE